MISEEKLKDLKDSVDIVDVIDTFTSLEKRGKYFVGICPFHNDDNLGSFKVDEQKQTYKCYSCGKGGDVIKFLVDTGKSFKESVEILEKGTKLTGEVKAKKKRNSVPLAEFKYIKPPQEIPEGKFVHSKFGKPTNIYTYRDVNGNVTGYVLRYLDSEGKKQILPYNYCTCVKSGWDYEYMGKGSGRFHKIGDVLTRFIGFSDSKPIYGLEKLKKYPKANVLILEGEKAVDYVQAQYNPEKVITLCWQSGTNNVDQVKWKNIFTNRRVWLIPDNDWGHEDREGNVLSYFEQPSQKAFTYIKEQIQSEVRQLFWTYLAQPEIVPSGWDLADTDWDSTQISEFILHNSNHLK